MKNDNHTFSSFKKIPEWLTIREAVKISKGLTKKRITKSDIYRNALSGNIRISIYFQSPVILRKVRISGHKIKIKSIDDSLINRLCLLERKCFLDKKSLIISTEGEYILSNFPILDTTLAGYEYVLMQRLLSRHLNIPLPEEGAKNVNYGISVSLSEEIFQLFERVTWKSRINRQINRLPKDIALEIYENISSQRIKNFYHREYFPMHDLPSDACFVIRVTELEKLINLLIEKKTGTASTTRISTPLSRLFWLACKHNEAISPLIRQPYKLLSIFEQWASDEGITDRFSGDTLKAALERGSPTAVAASKR
ncbi:hypothetical protein VSX61_01710 [Brenneria populi subsp. brevivirga]|uniref:hypothetical protein n=1 Tax=Brenneria populi TaxID=1505588 RepID=UPI002E176746|nr:hypothetical protein [Brenneria populi subsp. brevivirga]